jgi:Tol biopolymer transport system component
MKQITLLTALTIISVASAQGQPRKITSRLEIYDIETATRTVLKEYPYSIEAPNWTMDGRALIYNSGGKIYRVDIDNPANDNQIPTGEIERANNDHILSFDGTGLAISSGSAENGSSRIYVLPLAGGEPRLVTPEGPSYLHGWSPDGSTLAYCADRNGNYDVYTIPADGSGAEVRLTDAEGLDDGPEYSPDGRHIWFNSVRSGTMQVWRMRADGSKQTQITFDESRNAWFPHVSPDGRRAVYIAYDAKEVAPGDHPPGKDVELRLMSTRQSGEPQTVVKLFGGQGTINVNSWAPDSRRFAFVSYEYVE